MFVILIGLGLASDKNKMKMRMKYIIRENTKSSLDSFIDDIFSGKENKKLSKLYEKIMNKLNNK